MHLVLFSGTDVIVPVCRYCISPYIGMKVGSSILALAAAHEVVFVLLDLQI